MRVLAASRAGRAKASSSVVVAVEGPRFQRWRGAKAEPAAASSATRARRTGTTSVAVQFCARRRPATLRLWTEPTTTRLSTTVNCKQDSKDTRYMIKQIS